MNMIEIPPFDELIDLDGPTDCFGSLLNGEEYEEALLDFEKHAIQVKESVSEQFNLTLTDLNNVAAEMDTVISVMWSEGWDPNKGNLNLFCSHFGAILASFLKTFPNTKIIFRSKTDLDNLSIWHGPSKTEYFPFHKIAKCLTSEHGESVQQMANDIHRKAFGEPGA